jgi:hypothetical protein
MPSCSAKGSTNRTNVPLFHPSPLHPLALQQLQQSGVQPVTGQTQTVIIMTATPAPGQHVMTSGPATGGGATSAVQPVHGGGGHV